MFKKFFTFIALAALFSGCSSIQQEKVTEVSKWTLKNNNGCWSLSSSDKCCSKMVKVCCSSGCKCSRLIEESTCVTFPPDLEKINETEYYRVEMIDATSNTKVYWHNTKQLAKK